MDAFFWSNRHPHTLSFIPASVTWFVVFKSMGVEELCPDWMIISIQYSYCCFWEWVSCKSYVEFYLLIHWTILLFCKFGGMQNQPTTDPSKPLGYEELQHVEIINHYFLSMVVWSMITSWIEVESPTQSPRHRPLVNCMHYIHVLQTGI